MMIVYALVMADVINGNRLTGENHLNVPFLLNLAPLQISLGDPMGRRQSEMPGFRINQSQGASLGAHGPRNPLHQTIEYEVEIKGGIHQG